MAETICNDKDPHSARRCTRKKGHLNTLHRNGHWIWGHAKSGAFGMGLEAYEIAYGPWREE